MNDLSSINNAAIYGVPIGLIARPEYLDWEIPEYLKKTLPYALRKYNTLSEIFEYAQGLGEDLEIRKQQVLDHAERIAQRMFFGELEDLKIYLSTRIPPIHLSGRPFRLPSTFDTDTKIANLVKYHSHNENCPPIPRKHRHCVIL